MFQEFFPILEGAPMGGFWLLMFYGTAIVMLWMAALWLLHYSFHNAGLVDFGWASSLAFLGALCAIMADGYAPRRWLLGIMVLLWGGRLALHILFDRILGGKAEDPRYVALRERWPRWTGLRLLVLFESRAFLAILLSVPFAHLATDPLQRITGYEWAGFCLWAVAFLGEWAADAQLKRFRADPDNQGRVCQDGLWYHSRHPNYFFEWLVWVAYFIAALATPYGAWTVLCPLAMLWFMVSGIAALETHAVQSRGEEYIEYQSTTSRFIPWFKKSAAD